VSPQAQKIVIGIVVALVVLWALGVFDKVLAPTGLNAKNCVVTGYGETKCGAEAETLCKSFGGPGCRDAGFDTGGSLEEKFDDPQPWGDESNPWDPGR
jgi:hypothetical protein